MVRRVTRALPFLLALALAAAWLGGPLDAGGAWDPYELDAADAARRIAVHSFGAGELAFEGDPPGPPTLTDLGMGELPFTSMALSFRAFGLSDLAGRLPLAIWGAIGALSAFALLRRAGGAKAAIVGTLVLLTTPLYFLHARTMLGDIVSLASFAVALAGITLSLSSTSARACAAWGAVGALGVAAGFLTRGLLFGVAAPTLSAALAGLFAAPLLGGTAEGARRVRVASLALAVVAAAATVRFVALALPRVDTDAWLLREVGMTLWDATPNDSTFDRLLRQIGHGMFPWSALLPWALARALRGAPRAEPAAGETPSAATAPPSAGAAPCDRDVPGFLRAALLAACFVTFAAGAMVVPWTGALPYLGVVPLACLVALALADLDRGAPASPVAALATAATFALLVVDLTREPARALAGFVVPSAPLPTGQEELAKRAAVMAAALFAPVAALAALAPSPAEPLSPRAVLPFLRARAGEAHAAARSAGRAALAAFQGNLVFFLVVLEAGLVGLAAMVFIGRRAEWASIANLPRGVVDAALAAWWLAPVASLLAAVGAASARAVFDLLVASSRLGRGGVVAVVGGLSASYLALGFYPALAAELSPKQVFESYRELRAPGDELGLLGASPRAGTFYAGRPVPAFTDERSAFDWLSGAGERRRFLVVKARDLAKLNALWRAAHAENLPVLDVGRTENLLVSSSLGGRENASPLRDLVLDYEPQPARPLDIQFLEHVEALGWEVRSKATGEVVEELVPGQLYEMIFFYRVLDRFGDWQAFVHVDGRTRHNADHPVLRGQYPTPLWQPGDVVRDAVDIRLEPNFSPGEAWVFFGFFQGKERLRVSEGEHREHRAIAGRVRVR